MTPSEMPFVSNASICVLAVNVSEITMPPWSAAGQTRAG